jgi:hypothetical protein
MLVLIVCAQYLALIVGTYWGFATLYAIRPPLLPKAWSRFLAPLHWLNGRDSTGWFPAMDSRAIKVVLTSILAMALCVEGLRILATTRSRKDFGPRIYLYFGLLG